MIGRLWRSFVRYLFTLGEPKPVLRYSQGMSSAPVQTSVASFDDVQVRFDKKQMAFAVRQTAGSERLVERGWDWDRSVPDSLFMGQTVQAGPVEAQTRLREDHQRIARAADMFAAAADGVTPNLT